MPQNKHNVQHYYSLQ